MVKLYPWGKCTPKFPTRFPGSAKLAQCVIRPIFDIAISAICTHICTIICTTVVLTVLFLLLVVVRNILIVIALTFGRTHSNTTASILV